MSDGALKIPITGDASQFKATLGEIESSLKYFKEKLKSAKGDQVAKINFTIAGLEESKIALTTFGKFAEGTLGALNQQISELNRQKLNIKADAESLTPINQELDRLIKQRDELNKAGLGEPIVEAVRPAAESIAGLRLRIKELNDLKILIDPKINPSAIAKINKEIDGLEDKASNLDNLGSRIGSSTSSAAGGLKKFEDQSRQSRIAVTNLALVLQDLPFGFIAIQNNLPNLQSSFANLKASSDGVKGALQSFSSALIGPGGFFLAFSAVTGAVTYAVQKYGSLSAALDVLTSKNRIATEAQLEFNKAVSEESSNIGGRIAQIKILVENYQNESATQAERLAAFRALKDINPDIVAGIDEQNFATAASVKLVGQNAQAVINLIKVQTQQKGILKTLDGLEEKRFAANGKYNAARAKQIELESRLAKIDAKKSAGKALTSQERSLDVQRELARGEYAQSVKDASDEIAGITTEQDKWYNSLKPITTEVSNINSTLDTYIENLNKLRQSQKDASKGTKEFTEELRGPIPLFDIFSPSKEQFNFDLLKDFFGPNFIKQLKESQKKLNETEKELDKFRKQNADPILIKVVPKVSGDANNKFLEQKKFNEDIIEMLTKGLNLEKAYDKAIEDLLNFSEYSRKEIEKIAKDLRFLQEPLEGLFTTLLDEGKLSWKAFADDVIKQIKRIAAALLSKAIIQGIANILSPGSGAIVGRGLKAIDTDALGSYLDGNDWVDLLSGGPGSANFGGIRGNSSMNMAGQVNMVIRGNDLVGVMNRTNTTINRVG